MNEKKNVILDKIYKCNGLTISLRSGKLIKIINVTYKL